VRHVSVQQLHRLTAFILPITWLRFVAGQHLEAPSDAKMGERQKHEAAAPKASCGDLEKVLFLKSVQSFNNGGLILRPVDRRRVVADDQ
jgi:hypothetical protein